MRINSADGKTYKFTDDEVYTILMYAYGYVKLSEKNYTNIDIDKDYDTSVLGRKLKECMEGHLEVIEKTRV